MEEVCRICRTNSVKLINIFAKQAQLKKEPPLVDMLIECTSCKISLNDSLPQNICVNCILSAQNAYRFKRRCEKSHYFFYQLLGVEGKDNICPEKDKPLSECIVEDINTKEERLNDSEIDEDVSVGDCGLEGTHVKGELMDYQEHENDVTNIEDFSYGYNSYHAEQENDATSNEDSSNDYSNFNGRRSLPEAFTGRKTLHSCLTCGKQFATKWRLTVHKRIHSGERPYKCTFCPKVFNTEGSRKIHMRLHTGERPYKCSYCESAYTRSDDLQRHILIHTGERPHECPHCFKKFTQRSVLVNHIRIHTGEKPYKCVHCPKFFSRICHLRKHSMVHIKTNSKCHLCSKTLSSPAYLKRHMKMHETERIDENTGLRKTPKVENLSCGESQSVPPLDIHKYESVYVEDIQKSERVSAETSDTVYKEKKGETSSNSGEAWNMVTCEQIANDFNDQSICNEKTFHCAYCDKRFAKKSQLIRHSRVHTNTRPYKCDICSRTYKESSNLSRHKKVHKNVNRKV